MNLYRIIDQLLDNPGAIKLKLLNNAFSFAIPFNRPHGFQITNISKEEVSIEIPHKRINFNHLNGIHACAMATAGEYAAGILILKNFPFEKYRIILSSLKINYTYQGKSKIKCKASLRPENMLSVKNELEQSNKSNITILTELFDSTDKPVAAVESTWQLKSWKDVKTKV